MTQVDFNTDKNCNMLTSGNGVNPPTTPQCIILPDFTNEPCFQDNEKPTLKPRPKKTGCSNLAAVSSTLCYSQADPVATFSLVDALMIPHADARQFCSRTPPTRSESSTRRPSVTLQQIRNFRMISSSLTNDGFDEPAAAHAVSFLSSPPSPCLPRNISLSPPPHQVTTYHEEQSHDLHNILWLTPPTVSLDTNSDLLSVDNSALPRPRRPLPRRGSPTTPTEQRALFLPLL